MVALMFCTLPDVVSAPVQACEVDSDEGCDTFTIHGIAAFCHFMMYRRLLLCWAVKIDDPVAQLTVRIAQVGLRG